MCGPDGFPFSVTDDGKRTDWRGYVLEGGQPEACDDCGRLFDINLLDGGRDDDLLLCQRCCGPGWLPVATTRGLLRDQVQIVAPAIAFILIALLVLVPA